MNSPPRYASIGSPVHGIVLAAMAIEHAVPSYGAAQGEAALVL
ncbi:hypothetical protein GCM10027449_06130 [Sinomonas notoginsengisoli]|nr:hypothetical protein [Sinomonas notoginsengisoli]